MSDDDETVARAAYIIGDLLVSTLSRDLIGGSWDRARQPYIWEHNALCWLVRHRARLRLINAWTAMLLDAGYPSRPFTDSRGNLREAGAYWNASMEPRADSMDEPMRSASADAPAKLNDGENT